MSILQTTALRRMQIPVIFLELAQRRGFIATTTRATPVWFGRWAAALKGLMWAGSLGVAAFWAWDSTRRVPITRRALMLRSGWRRAINFSLLWWSPCPRRRTPFGGKA